MLRLVTSTALVVAALALLVAAPSAQSASNVEKCGKHIVNGTGWWKLKAKEASCKTATKLADYFVFEAGGVDPGFNEQYRDWVFAKARVGNDTWQVQATRDKGTKNQLVTFIYEL